MDVVECAVKHCDAEATLGMTLVINGVRVELDLCEPHFDAIDMPRPSDAAPEKQSAPDPEV